MRNRVASIYKAAVTLFGERPPEVVTMEEIAASAGVAKGTLYNYFQSKEELVRSLLGARMDELIGGLTECARSEGDWETRLRRMIDHVFRFQVESPDWFRMRRRAEGDAGPREVVREREEQLRAAIQTVLDDAGLPECRPAPDAALILGAIDGAVASALENGGDLATHGDELWRFVRHALTGTGSLGGRTIVVTREESERGPLSSALLTLGAHVVRVPLITTLPPEDPAPLRREASRLESWDWVFLTSARGAHSLTCVAPANPAPRRIAVVGEATARVIREHGWEPDVVGHGGAAELVQEMSASSDLRGAAVLFPAAERPLPDGVRALLEAGAEVARVTAYRTVPREGATEALARAFSNESVDAVTFASASAVNAYLAASASTSWPDPAMMCAGALGPSAVRALERAGFREIVVAERPQFRSLAEALSRHFTRER